MYKKIYQHGSCWALMALSIALPASLPASTSSKVPKLETLAAVKLLNKKAGESSKEVVTRMSDILANLHAEEADVVTPNFIKLVIDLFKDTSGNVDEQAIVNTFEEDLSGDPDTMAHYAALKAGMYTVLAQQHQMRVAHRIADIKAVTDGWTPKKGTKISAQEVTDYFKAKIKNPSEEGSVIVANALQSARKAAEKNINWLIHVACGGATTDASGQPLDDPNRLPDEFELIGVPDANKRGTLEYFEDWKYLSDNLSDIIAHIQDISTWGEVNKQLWSRRKLLHGWDLAEKNNNQTEKINIAHSLSRTPAALGGIALFIYGVLIMRYAISRQEIAAIAYLIDIHTNKPDLLTPEIHKLFSATWLYHIRCSKMKYLPQGWHYIAPHVYKIEVNESTPSVIDHILKKTDQLIQLSTLDLTNCSLHQVPKEIFKLSSLKKIDLTGNQLSDIPLELLPENIFRYFPNIARIVLEENPLIGAPDQNHLYKQLKIELSKRQAPSVSSAASSAPQTVHAPQIAWRPWTITAGAIGGALAGNIFLKRILETFPTLSSNLYVQESIPLLYGLAGLGLAQWATKRFATLTEQRTIAQFNADQAVSSIQHFKPSLLTAGAGLLGGLAGAWLTQQPSLQNTGWILPGTGLAAGALAGSMITAVTEKE